MTLIVLLLVVCICYLLYRNYKATQAAKSTYSALLTSFAAASAVGGAKKFVEEYTALTSTKLVGSDDSLIYSLYDTYNLPRPEHAIINDDLKEVMTRELHEYTKRRRATLEKESKS